jgi:hypothetical protein
MNTNQYGTMVSMMGGGKGQAPIPTQTFNAANILGTPLPSVGDAKGIPLIAAHTGTISPRTTVMVAIALFAVGYLAFHFNFEV